MRSLFLAWVALALILLGLGRLHAGTGYEVSQYVSATEQEAAEGYFAFGQDAMVVVKQGSGLQHWLKAHTGERIRLTLEPEVGTDE